MKTSSTSGPLPKQEQSAGFSPLQPDLAMRRRSGVNAAVRLQLTALTLLASVASSSAQDCFANWPAGAAPQEVGRRVAENFLARQLDFQTNPKRKYVIYPEVCAWYGSLTVAQLTGDTNLQERLIRKFDLLLTPEGAKRISPDEHVDYRVFGVVPLELYLQTKDVRYRALGQRLADQQWAKTNITRFGFYLLGSI